MFKRPKHLWLRHTSAVWQNSSGIANETFYSIYKHMSLINITWLCGSVCANTTWLWKCVCKYHVTVEVCVQIPRDCVEVCVQIPRDGVEVCVQIPRDGVEVCVCKYHVTVWKCVCANTTWLSVCVCKAGAGQYQHFGLRNNGCVFSYNIDLLIGLLMFANHVFTIELILNVLHNLIEESYFIAYLLQTLVPNPICFFVCRCSLTIQMFIAWSYT